MTMTKKVINLFYDKSVNFGDALGPFLVERLFGIPCVLARKTRSEMIALGSVLQRFSTDSFIASTQKMFYPCLHVWTTGFIDDRDDTFFKRNVEIYALRGDLSRKRCEKILDKSLSDIPLGDGGLLAATLLEKRPVKKYSLGIVPHLVDSKNPTIHKLQEENKGSILIDIAKPPLEVLTQIASCECIASTSLHGLIVSDSLGIPNKWIRVSNKIEGNNFKFNDYYSAFGLTDIMPCRLSTIDIDTMRSLMEKSVSEYQIKASVVSDIQKKLIQAFPFSKEG